jgi:hypothetical protein
MIIFQSKMENLVKSTNLKFSYFFNNEEHKAYDMLGQLYIFIIKNRKRFHLKNIHMKKWKRLKKTCNNFIEWSHWLLLTCFDLFTFFFPTCLDMVSSFKKNKFSLCSTLENTLELITWIKPSSSTIDISHVYLVIYKF